jgi:uncharacterized protein affecting Mg2+/Co2+ transport
MKRFNYIGHNKYLKISIHPHFLITKSLPLFFHYEWEVKIEIINKTEDFLILNNATWEVTDNLGRITTKEEHFFQKNKNYLLYHEEYTNKSNIPLQSPGGVLQGYLTFKKENCTKRINIKIPSTLLDGPFNKKTYH